MAAYLCRVIKRLSSDSADRSEHDGWGGVEVVWCFFWVDEDGIIDFHGKGSQPINAGH